MISNHSPRKIAILIDGENAEAKALPLYLNQASKYGKVTTKRIYGDWTSFRMNKWKDQLNITAFRPIQKFAYTKNKNSTDTALIIDAMDLLHQGSADGFCIVSSDSDYTGLCHRVREHGKFVMGIGKSFTPEAFVNACEVFIYSDLLLDRSIPSETIASTSTFSVSTNHPTEIACEMSSLAVDVHDVGTLGSSAVTAVTPPRLISSCPMPSQPTPLPWDFVNQAFESSVDVTGKAHFSSLSNCFRKMDPLFDHRKFGFMSFRKLCETFSPDYEVIEAVRPSDGRLNFALVRKGAKQLVVLRDYDVNSDSRSAKKGRTY